MDVDNHPVAEDRNRRATSVLSMDDIEAAQALEGLRAGNFCSFLGCVDMHRRRLTRQLIALQITDILPLELQRKTITPPLRPTASPSLNPSSPCLRLPIR